MGRGSSCRRNDLIRDLIRHIGETVTIFTTSGGESGRGFTGILVGLDPTFVRLIAVIGPAPACALGSCCDRHGIRHCDGGGSRRNGNFDEDDVSEEEDFGVNENIRFECGRIRNTGAIVDIPVNRIAAFVHNSLS